MSLKETIMIDCQLFEEKCDKFIGHYLYLNECENSATSGLYQLIFNGMELWYGPLEEINAVVKSMLTLLTHPADYNLQGVENG